MQPDPGDQYGVLCLRDARKPEERAAEGRCQEEFAHGAIIGAMRKSVNCSSEKRIG
jgi:hypothetical protein